ERRVEPVDLLGTLERIVWHLDEPSLALGVYPQWHVMALARDAGVKVVLDGQGGDEVFAGYTNYASQHLYGLLGSQPMRFPFELAALGRVHGWPHARSAARSAVAMRLRRPTTPTVDQKMDAALLAHVKRRAGWSKYGLRRALDDLLPSSVVWRRDKKGFPTPVGNWLRDGRASAAVDLLSDPHRKSRDIFPQAAVDAFVREHVN